MFIEKPLNTNHRRYGKSDKVLVLWDLNIVRETNKQELQSILLSAKRPL